jgi:hypothetical protein
MMRGSMRPPNTIILYEDRLVSLWERLVMALGIHTARVLLARAIWQSAQRHPDIALIHHDDAGLTFDTLETRCATRPQKEIEAAFTDLSAELLLILDRLLGREMAQQIGAAHAGARPSLATSADVGHGEATPSQARSAQV